VRVHSSFILNNNNNNHIYVFASHTIATIIRVIKKRKKEVIDTII